MTWWEDILGITALKAERDKFKQRAEDKSVEIKALLGQILEKNSFLRAYKKAVRYDNKLYEITIKKLKLLEKKANAMYEAALNVPDIKDLVKNHIVYNPWTDTRLDMYQKNIADNEYYAFTKDTWEKIIALAYVELKEQMPEYVKELADCDNFADVLDGIIEMAFFKSGKQRQGAFGTAWSNGHAYNFFVDSTMRIWLVEPQYGKIIGEIGDDYTYFQLDYKTKKIFFMG